MKSELKLEGPKEKYPCLMICVKGPDKGVVVLFDYEHSGTVVYRGEKGSHLGYSEEGWDMTEFEPFSGTVTLEA